MATVNLVGQEREEILNWSWATESIYTTEGALVFTYVVSFPDWRADMDNDGPSIETTLDDRNSGNNDWIGEWAEDAVREELGLGWAARIDAEIVSVGWDGDVPQATITVVAPEADGWDD